MMIPRADKTGVRMKTMERSGVTDKYKGKPHEAVELGRQASLAAFGSDDPEEQYRQHAAAEGHFGDEVTAREDAGGDEMDEDHIKPYEGAKADQEFHGAKRKALEPTVKAILKARHEQKGKEDQELKQAQEALIGMKKKPSKTFKAGVRAMTLEAVQAKQKDFA